MKKADLSADSNNVSLSNTIDMVNIYIIVHSCYNIVMSFREQRDALLRKVFPCPEVAIFPDESSDTTTVTFEQGISVHPPLSIDTSGFQGILDRHPEGSIGLYHHDPNAYAVLSRLGRLGGVSTVTFDGNSVRLQGAPNLDALIKKARTSAREIVPGLVVRPQVIVKQPAQG